MANPVADLRQLEAAVRQAAQALGEVTKDKARLTRAVASLTEENQRLRDQLRKYSAADALHKKLRKRLERIALKLDKIGAP